MDGKTLIMVLVNGSVGVLLCLWMGGPVLTGLWAVSLVCVVLGWLAEKKGWV